MFTQVIINNQYVLSVLHPLFANGTSCIRSDVLQRSQIRSCGNYNGSVIHGSELLQRLNNVGHRRCLLANGYINAVNTLAFLVNDGINGNGCLTGLTVADNKLTLSPSNRNHGVNSLDSGLEGSIYGFPLNYAVSHTLNTAELISFNRAFAVKGLPQSIYYTSCHGIAHRNLYHSACGFYRIAFTDPAGITKQNRTNVVLFQVQNHAVDFSRKLQKFSLHGAFKTVDTGDTVSNLDNGTDVGHLKFGRILFYLFFNHRTNFFRPQIHEGSHLFPNL